MIPKMPFNINILVDKRQPLDTPLIHNISHNIYKTLYMSVDYLYSSSGPFRPKENLVRILRNSQDRFTLSNVYNIKEIRLKLITT